MDANNRGKRSKDKPKDAAEGTPMKGEKEYMEEEDVSRVAVIEKELNGLKDDVNEIKALLARVMDSIWMKHLNVYWWTSGYILVFYRCFV